MDLKKHFVKRYVFTVLFSGTLLIFSVMNFIHEAPAILEYIQATPFSASSTYIGSLEAAIDDNVYRKADFIEAYGLVQRILDKNEENDFEYIRDNNGYLLKGGFDEETSVTPWVLAGQINELNELCKEYGVPLMIVRVPEKNLYNTAPVELGLPKMDRNYYADDLQGILAYHYGIEMFDSAAYLTGLGYTYQDIFYKTDHHWRIEIAFEAYRGLLQYMNEAFGAGLDPDGYYRDLENYNVLVYEDSFIGSMSRDAGVIYGGVDDFTLIYPKFETDYDCVYVKNDGRNLEQRGGVAEESLLFTGRLAKSTIEDGDNYSVYLNGIYYEDHIVNRMNPEGPKALIIRDSLMSPVITFMASSFSEIDALWYEMYEGDIEELLQAKEYDFVILDINPLAGFEKMMRCLGDDRYIDPAME